MNKLRTCQTQRSEKYGLYYNVVMVKKNMEFWKISAIKSIFWFLVDNRLRMDVLKENLIFMKMLRRYASFL